MEMAEELRKEGNEAYYRGDLEAAMGAYSSALELSPMNASLLCNRSLVAAKMGRFNESLNDAVLAINASQPGDPIVVKAHFRKAAALGALSKVAEAIDALRAGMRYSPGDASLGRELWRLMRLLTHSQLAKVWAGLIDYGEKPSGFSSRDGRLLKPVQGSGRLDLNATVNFLSMVFESSAYFRTQAESTIAQAWCRGRDYCTKDGIGVMRALAYLKAGDPKQAMTDAKFAVAYAKGDGCIAALAVKAMVHADLNEFTLAALEMTGALEISKYHILEFVIFVDNVSSKMPRQHREALENGGPSGLKAWLEEEEEHNKPEYLRKRPKYYYYYEWTRKRIEERCPGLPEPVMDKLLTMDSNELDLLLQHEEAIKGQAMEFIEVYERNGPEVLETYKTPQLSWDEVKALEGPGTVGLGTGGGTAPGSGFLEYKRDTDHALIGGAGEAGFMTEAEKAGKPIAPRLPPDQMRDQLNIMTATAEAQQKLLNIDHAALNSQDSGTDALPHAQTALKRKIQIFQSAEEKLFKSNPEEHISIENQTDYHRQ